MKKPFLCLILLAFSTNVIAGADIITNSFSHKIATISIRSYNGIDRCFVETTSFGNGATTLFFDLITPGSSMMYSQLRDAKREGSPLVILYNAGVLINSWAPQNGVWTNNNNVKQMSEIVAIMTP